MPTRLEPEDIDAVLAYAAWRLEPNYVEPDELPAWHRIELARRRAEAQAKPGEGRPWREVLDSMVPAS